MKKAIDLLVSTAAFVVLLPIIIAIAVLIKTSSKGPVFHMSRRVGAHNSEFRMYKFRTMMTGTPQLATHLMKSPDMYLTKVGSLLRKTSLDELPQLFNVMKGEMSLVGPRPALFNQNDQIELRTKAGCHVLLPGITGWAQIHGRDDIPIVQKVDLDSWYFHNRSLWLDLKILWLTAWRVLARKGVQH